MKTNIRDWIRSVFIQQNGWVLQITPIYRLYLMLRYRVTKPRGCPIVPWENSVLQTNDDIDVAMELVNELGLYSHHSTLKNWDSITALYSILKFTNNNARVFDAGAETYSPLLPWLFLYNYTELSGMNIAFPNEFRFGPIKYLPGDITCTKLPNNYFDAVACLSVIEHGLDIESFFVEMSRIVKLGGILVISTDYYESSIDTNGLEAYGTPIRIFTKEDIKNMIDIASKYDFSPPLELSYECKEKVVKWKTLEYTFIIFIMRKNN